MEFVKFTTTLNGHEVTVDIAKETGFISDWWHPTDEDWTPNGLERKQITEQFFRHEQTQDQRVVNN